MDCVIETVGVLELDRRDLARCRKLTLPNGLMRRCLDELRKSRPERAERSVVIMARCPTGKIVGWGLCFENRYGRRELYLFVDEDYRRQGVGSALVVEARRRYPRHKIVVRPWNGPSYAFYERFPRLVPQGSPGYLSTLQKEAEKLRREQRDGGDVVESGSERELALA